MRVVEIAVPPTAPDRRRQVHVVRLDWDTREPKPGLLWHYAQFLEPFSNVEERWLNSRRQDAFEADLHQRIAAVFPSVRVRSGGTSNRVSIWMDNDDAITMIETIEKRAT